MILKTLNHATLLESRAKYFGSVLKLATHSDASSTYIPDNLEVPFDKKYDIDKVEEDKNRLWDEYIKNGKSRDITTKSDETFSMILPPPNVTGTLHLGHALTVTIQDILCRWKRMLGVDVVWVPGMDHAGIATQVVVEKYLRAEKGLTRQQLGREKFIEEVRSWKENKCELITKQLKELAATLDWDRQFFTMDSKLSEAVTEAIIRLHENGLLYRQDALVNWCFNMRTAISDIEVETVLSKGKTALSVPGYSKPVVFGVEAKFAYPLWDSTKNELLKGDVLLSSDRLETVFGEVALAINPGDRRHAHLEGAAVWHPFRKCAIPVIKDKSVDPEIGNGVMRVIPGHCQASLVLAKSHKLPIISIFEEDGTMNLNCHDISGLKRFDAHKAVLQRMRDTSILRGLEEKDVEIKVCSRSKDIIQQLLKPQWFLKCASLSEKILELFEKGEFSIEPETCKNECLIWLKDERDWCISRQIWWGHRLPLYCSKSGDWVAARSVEDARNKYAQKFGGTEDVELKQDEDVCDTWFSSALLPFSVFGWPQKRSDVEKYYPLSLMETGNDIVCFWVLRMAMLGYYLTNQLPFQKIVLHGLITDWKGRKMSKSSGNVINPEDVIQGMSPMEMKDRLVESKKSGILSDKDYATSSKELRDLFPNGIPKCGTDALRLTLASYTLKSRFMFFSPSVCVDNHKFCNKLWQACRLVIGWSEKLGVTQYENVEPVNLMQRWILSRLAFAIQRNEMALNSVDIDLGIFQLKHFLHHEFCDVFLELCKPVLRHGTADEKASTCAIMLFCVEQYLKLMHPVIPSITQYLYQFLPGQSHTQLMFAKYPAYDQCYSRWRSEILDSEIEYAREIVQRIRCIRSTNKVPLQAKNNAIIVTDASRREIINRHLPWIQQLVGCDDIATRESPNIRENESSIVNLIENHTEIHLILPADQDKVTAQYVATLEKKHKLVLKGLSDLEKRTSKKTFHSKSNEVKEFFKNKRKTLEDERERLEEIMGKYNVKRN